MQPLRSPWTVLVVAASAASLHLAQSWNAGIALAYGIGLGLLCLAGLRPHGRVRAVRRDADFGRIGLFDDGTWRGSVELPPLERPLDLEVGVVGAGPTVSHRIALRDARRRLPEMLDEIGAAIPTEGVGVARFLTLRLPAEDRAADYDWALEGVVEGEPSLASTFEVRVRDGRILYLVTDVEASL